ncbi:MAG: alpha-amylase [Gemmatimonadetes bacterium]|nr:alpha-amylase [Gemmatimonadota bacterium]
MRLRAALLFALLSAACTARQSSPPARELAAPAEAIAPAASPAAGSALYEVFVRAFSPSGNVQGVIDGLDRIEATGANVLWLMPIHPLGVRNRKEPLGSSYSVRDYRAINPDYGTAADFRALVSAAHARGLRLILDWVPNHTAWDHVWMRQHPDFYLRDAQGNPSVPRDNDGKLTDWTDVADLDYGNPALRRAMIADMRYWLDEFGIDGFRVDVAGMVPADFWREAIPQLRAGRNILLLAESGDLALHRLGFDLSYAWDSYSRLKAVWQGDSSAASFVPHELADMQRMPPGGRRLRFVTNHDETAWDRPPVTLFGGPAGARAAFAAMTLLPGTPLLYNGQEVESPQQLGLFAKEAVAWAQPNAAEARAFYRRVIELARTEPALAGNLLSAVETDASGDVISYRRNDPRNTSDIIVLINPRNRPLTVRVRGTPIVDARDLLTGVIHRGSSFLITAYGVLILQLHSP